MELNDWFLSTKHTDPTSENEAFKIYVSTVFDIGPDVARPYTRYPREFSRLDTFVQQLDYRQLNRAFQRHIFTDYCLNKNRKNGNYSGQVNQKYNQQLS